MSSGTREISISIRIFLYTLTDDPWSLILLQALDGIGVGIFDVTAVALCADITRGSRHFNALCGAMATAGGLGGVVGPLLGGVILQQYGFSAAFAGFAAIAGVAAVVFVREMPHTAARDIMARDFISSFDRAAKID